MPHAISRVAVFRSGVRFFCALAVVALCNGAVTEVSRADEPLHERIDRLIEADQLVPLAPAAGDAEFLRRLTLDLIGRIPTTAETRAFLDDASPEKRNQAIDRLLASPDFARHMANVFDVALMERRPSVNVPLAEWQKYLLDSFQANKPYDQLVQEILSADGVDPATRARARFYLDREGEANLLTRDVGRIFLGMDLQCAQCHDHPIIADYYQADYQGLYAYFNRGLLFTDKEKKVFFAEKAEGDATYQSVFVASQKGTALPHLPGGDAQPEPVYAKGDEYIVAPADNVRPVPKYSRRARLAGELAGAQNPLFARTIVNRLWAQVMGRGLVEPVDLHHDANTPSHPAVLALLSESFPAMKFDIKALLGELVRTRAYARSLDLPAEVPAQATQLAAQLATWEAERARLATVAEASQQVAATAAEEVAKARAAVVPVAEELTKAQLAVAEAEKSAATASAALAAAQSALPTKEEAAKLVAEANARTAEAAQKLADDKEIADAAAKLKARNDQLAAEVAALTKAVAEGPAAVKTTSEQLAAAQQACAAIGPRIDPLRAQVVALAPPAVATGAQARADSLALVAMARRIEDAKSIVGFSQALAAVEPARVEITQAQTELLAVDQQLTGAAAQVEQAGQVLAAAQQAVATATSALDADRRVQSDRQATIDAVNEALAKTELAQQKLPAGDELAAAIQALKTKSTELTTVAKAAETALGEKTAAVNAATEQATGAQQQVDAATAQQGQLAAQAKAVAERLAAAKQKLDSEAALADVARRTVIERTSARCAVAVLKHLTPEQLGLSMMQASGAIERERVAVEAEWNKNHPTPDAAAQVARAGEIETALQEKLKPSVAAFVTLFAAAPGQPQQGFQATVDQALFLANGGPVRGWLAPAEGNLTDRVAKLTGPQQAADELYLTVLSRRPDPVEVADMTNYLSSRTSDRAAAVAELTWALFCSAEFRFNH